MLIIVPAAAFGIVALAFGQAAIAVAVAPAPLVAPGIVSRIRGRVDLAGALVLGTAILSLVVAGAQLPAGGMVYAFEAYAVAAMIAGALPTLRDLVLLPLRVAGWGAFGLILLNGALLQPSITPSIIGIAFVLFVAGIAAATAVALLTGRDVGAAIAGAGLRDPALATAIAALASGPDSLGVALAYGVFCLGLAGIALVRG